MGERDKPHSYRHEPSDPRETTPPSSWRRWRCHWGRWRPPRQRPVGVLPLQSAAPGLCFMVSVFRRCSSQSTSGGYFIVGFRSRRSRGQKDRWQRSHEAENKGSHAAKESGRVGPCVLALGPPLLRLLCSYAFFLPKNDPRKFIGHLDVVWVPETKKYRK